MAKCFHVPPTSLGTSEHTPANNRTLAGSAQGECVMERVRENERVKESEREGVRE